MFENAFWIAAIAWRNGKETIEHAVAVDNAALHVVAGVTLFVGVASLLSSRRRRELAWISVLAFAVWNELVDIATERWPDISQQYAEAAFDLWATLAFPTAALIIASVWAKTDSGVNTSPDAGESA